jgi:hypothetical protein
MAAQCSRAKLAAQGVVLCMTRPRTNRATRGHLSLASPPAFGARFAPIYAGISIHGQAEPSGRTTRTKLVWSALPHCAHTPAGVGPPVLQLAALRGNPA